MPRSRNSQKYAVTNNQNQYNAIASSSSDVNSAASSSRHANHSMSDAIAQLKHFYKNLMEHYSSQLAQMLKILDDANTIDDAFSKLNVVTKEIQPKFNKQLIDDDIAKLKQTLKNLRHVTIIDSPSIRLEKLYSNQLINHYSDQLSHTLKKLDSEEKVSLLAQLTFDYITYLFDKKNHKNDIEKYCSKLEPLLNEMKLLNKKEKSKLFRQKDKNGKTLLCRVAEYADIDLAELIKLINDLDSEDRFELLYHKRVSNNGMSAFSKMAFHCPDWLSKQIKNFMADLTSDQMHKLFTQAYNERGRTVLMTANADPTELKILLKCIKRLNLDKQTQLNILSKTDHYDQNALMHAARQKNSEALIMLLKFINELKLGNAAKDLLSKVNKSGKTAYMIAKSKQPDVLKRLESEPELKKLLTSTSNRTQKATSSMWSSKNASPSKNTINNSNSSSSNSTDTSYNYQGGILGRAPL